MKIDIEIYHSDNFVQLRINTFYEEVTTIHHFKQKFLDVNTYHFLFWSCFWAKINPKPLYIWNKILEDFCLYDKRFMLSDSKYKFLGKLKK